MASIMIVFQTDIGRDIPAFLPSDFTMDDFVNLARDKIGGFSFYHFIIEGKQVDPSDASKLNSLRNFITDNCKIRVSLRLSGCFLSDTLIMRADNSEVPISTIQPGDALLSFTNTGEIVTTTVQEIFVRNVDDYIELQTGEDKTVSVTPDHWIYVGKESFTQLKNLRTNDSVFVLLNVEDGLTAKSITALKPIAAPSIRVYNLHTAEPHTYFANGIAVHNMSGNMGISFVDVSNESGLQHIEFSNTAPPWRIAASGLSLEGKCRNVSCVAHQKDVIINIGLKTFNVLTDANAQTSKCPICLQYVEPKTCGFTDCLWRWSGIKKPESGLPPVEIPPCHWKEVDNTYDRFHEQSSGSIIWLKLILEASSKHRHHG